MAANNRKLGRSATETTEKKRGRALFYFIFGPGVMAMIYLLFIDEAEWGIGGGVVLALFAIWQLALGRLSEKAGQKKLAARQAVRAAKAEETARVPLEQMLSGLGADYVTLREVAGLYGKIDYLVISREGGIFVVQTSDREGRVELAKNGSLLFDGQAPQEDSIAQVMENCGWVRDQAAGVLGKQPGVTPLLVFTSAFLRGNLKVNGVMALNKKNLLPLLKSKKAGDAAAVWDRREEICKKIRDLGQEFAGI